jgi:serine/threonine protein kinase
VGVWQQLRQQLTRSHADAAGPLQVIAPLLRVLSVLHGEHSVVHRDIKPENIFLTAGGALPVAAPVHAALQPHTAATLPPAELPLH